MTNGWWCVCYGVVTSTRRDHDENPIDVVAHLPSAGLTVGKWMVAASLEIGAGLLWHLYVLRGEVLPDGKSIGEAITSPQKYFLPLYYAK